MPEVKSFAEILPHGGVEDALTVEPGDIEVEGRSKKNVWY